MNELMEREPLETGERKREVEGRKKKIPAPFLLVNCIMVVG